ncbi:MAG: tetratricopeptide repeat protein, partial [Candidatus Neomarinimicrobiota bacterium]
ISDQEFTALGNKLCRLGRFAEAIEIFRLNVEAFPESGSGYTRLGDAYFYAGQHAAARDNYQKALEIDPNNAKAASMVAGEGRYYYTYSNETNEPLKYRPGGNTGLKGPYLGQAPPGAEPEVFAPGIISTRGSLEYSQTFYPDGSEFYFYKGSVIYVSRLDEQGWSAPQPVSFDGPGLDHEPHITPDGRKMYFGSERAVGEEESSYGIWMVERQGDTWGAPQYHGPGMYVSTTMDGEIYMIDIDPETENEGIISYRITTAGRTEPVQLGGGVNSPASGAHPTVAPDGSYIIFDSIRPEGFGHLDLYICFRTDDGSWGEAINLGERINTIGPDATASISPDGKYLFYRRNRDIYWVSMEFIVSLENDGGI